MSETPALSKAVEGLNLMTGNTSNHHRYGEVKTRLTIGASGDFAGLFAVARVVTEQCTLKNGRVTVPKR